MYWLFNQAYYGICFIVGVGVVVRRSALLEADRWFTSVGSSFIAIVNLGRFSAEVYLKTASI